MIRINNALSKNNPPTPHCFEWTEFDMDSHKKTYKPRPKDSCFDEKAREVWKCYFDAVFNLNHNAYNLWNRLSEWEFSEASAENLNDLFEYIKPDTKNISKSNLLKLLIARPDDPDITNLLNLVSANSDRNKVQKLFDYDKVSGFCAFQRLVLLLNVNVCPYCGRSFTSTVKKNRGKIVRTNQIDHFMPKKVYPQLALSLWNFIPCCASCNQRKSERLLDIPYPYSEEMGDLLRFNIAISKDLNYMMSFCGSENFKITLKAYPSSWSSKEKDLIKKLMNEAEALHLEELYSSHGDYVGYMCLQRMVFNDEYIEELTRTFPELFKSPDDVRKMLYMKSIRHEDIGTVPLDKMTRDIDMQLDEFIDKE